MSQKHPETPREGEIAEGANAVVMEENVSQSSINPSPTYRSLVQYFRGDVDLQTKIDKCYRSIAPLLKKDIGESNVRILKEKIRLLHKTFHSKMTKWRNYDAFERNKKNVKWLQIKFDIPSQFLLRKTPQKSLGRPQKEFKNKSVRNQEKEIAQISKTQIGISPKRLLKATSKTLKVKGKLEESKIVKHIVKGNQTPKEILDKISKNQQPIGKFTPEEALTLLLDLNLTLNQYQILRERTLEKGIDLFPSYKTVENAKKSCRPEIYPVITDTKAEIPLKELLKHTATRIVKLQSEVILQNHELIGFNDDYATLICSWGFDGSSGQSRYKQKYTVHEDKEHSDANLFATTLIPLRLIGDGNKIYWQNKTPQSTRFCRPIKLEYIKESEEIILAEKALMDEQIRNLDENGIIIQLNDSHTTTVKFDMNFTIIDGKVLNAVTGTRSQQTCAICKATPSMFNDLSNVKKGKFASISENLKFGLSPLHAYIRLFELCLHLSYRMPFKTWQVRTEEFKKIYKDRKLFIQKELMLKMGLRADYPNANGSGNSNDGNTARRAFKDHKIFASILQIDEQFIFDLKIILIALNCQLEIDSKRFGNKCRQVADLYVKLYKWYPMPATLHKVLIHGEEIMNNSLLPLGMLGEEGGESRNKIYKFDRLHHTRKSSRIKSLTDLFNRALDTSDPIISSQSLYIRKKYNKKIPFPHDVIELLKPPDISRPENDDEVSFDDWDDDVGVGRYLNICLTGSEEFNLD